MKALRNYITLFLFFLFHSTLGQTSGEINLRVLIKFSGEACPNLTIPADMALVQVSTLQTGGNSRSFESTAIALKMDDRHAIANFQIKTNGDDGTVMLNEITFSDVKYRFSLERTRERFPPEGINLEWHIFLQEDQTVYRD